MASGKFSLWIVAFACLFYKRTSIAVIHGSEVNFKNGVLKWSINLALKQFSKVIAVSNYTKSLIDHLNHKNVYVIPNGLDLSQWETKTHKPLVIKGQPKLITVGNVTERKGQLNVIKMLPEILQSFPELQYHCVGIPTDAERFLSVAKALNVDKHVTFHGKVDDTHLRQFILASDVFVMLSSATATGDVEGFGIAILEANAMGVPAIGSLGCGIEDAIHEGKSGLLVQHNDAKAFTSALQQLFEHKTEFSKQAKVWAHGHDWKINIKKYIEVIEGVMRTGDGGRVTGE
jgi:phosphatidylinositol alpha-1,6-mannosyltransferase